jgi:hypothetical protein
VLPFLPPIGWSADFLVGGIKSPRDQQWIGKDSVEPWDIGEKLSQISRFNSSEKSSWETIQASKNGIVLDFL